MSNRGENWGNAVEHLARYPFCHSRMLTRRFDAAAGHWLSEGLVIRAGIGRRLSRSNEQIARFDPVKGQFVTNGKCGYSSYPQPSILYKRKALSVRGQVPQEAT